MKRNRNFSWLSLLGILLVLAGLTGLFSGPDLCQYAFAPEMRPDAAKTEALEGALEGICDTVSLHGTSDGESLSANRKSQGGIHLIHVGGGYGEIYPRAMRAGRPVSREDAAAGSRVIVLDEELAFRLFVDQDPLGQKVELGGKEYEVIGVAARVRRVGERGEVTAWIPLGVQDAPPAENLILTAFGKKSGSLRTVFENSARETVGPGTGWDLGKERVRGTIPLQAAAMAAGLWLLAGWIRWMKKQSAVWVGQIRERSKTRYYRQMAGYAALRVLGLLLLWGGTAAAAAGIAVWISRLMLVFPEWVPENMLSVESWAARFRSLTADAAAPVIRRTEEITEIRFWSGMIRWGLITALLGLGIRRPIGKKDREPEKTEAESAEA